MQNNWEFLYVHLEDNEFKSLYKEVGKIFASFLLEEKAKHSLEVYKKEGEKRQELFKETFNLNKEITLKNKELDKKIIEIADNIDRDIIKNLYTFPLNLFENEGRFKITSRNGNGEKVLVWIYLDSVEKCLLTYNLLTNQVDFDFYYKDRDDVLFSSIYEKSLEEKEDFVKEFENFKRQLYLFIIKSTDTIIEQNEYNKEI